MQVEGESRKTVGGRVAALVVVVAVGLGACGGGGSTPISEQSCRELVKTLHGIQADEAPGADTATQADATKRAGELNARVDSLGGCPDEPALQ